MKKHTKQINSIQTIDQRIQQNNKQIKKLKDKYQDIEFIEFKDAIEDKIIKEKGIALYNKLKQNNEELEFQKTLLEENFDNSIRTAGIVGFAIAGITFFVEFLKTVAELTVPESQKIAKIIIFGVVVIICTFMGYTLGNKK